MSKYWRIHFDRTMDSNHTPYWGGSFPPPYPQAAERTYVEAQHDEYTGRGLEREWVEKGHGWVSPTFGEYWDIPTLLRKAFEACLTPNANGYPGLFILDGGALCYECGITSLMDPDDDDLEHVIDWAYQDNHSGMTCDACSQYIYEPHCAACFTDESEVGPRGLYYNSSGDRCICRNCILEGWERAQAIGDRKLLPHRIFTDLLAVGVYEVGSYDAKYGDKPQHYRSHVYGDSQAVYDYTRALYAEKEANQ